MLFKDFDNCFDTEYNVDFGAFFDLVKPYKILHLIKPPTYIIKKCKICNKKTKKFVIIVIY